MVQGVKEQRSDDQRSLMKCVGGPFAPGGRPDAHRVEPSNGPIEIACTTVTHNPGDGIDSKSNNTYIHHCIVANNNCDHVKLWGTGSSVENTLIYGRGDGNPAHGLGTIVIETEPNARVTIANVAVDDALGGNYLMAVNYPHPERSIKLTVTNTIFNGRGENSPHLPWLRGELHLLEQPVLDAKTRPRRGMGGQRYIASEVGRPVVDEEVTDRFQYGGFDRESRKCAIHFIHLPKSSRFQRFYVLR